MCSLIVSNILERGEIAPKKKLHGKIQLNETNAILSAWVPMRNRLKWHACYQYGLESRIGRENGNLVAWCTKWSPRDYTHCTRAISKCRGSCHLAMTNRAL